MTSSTQVLHRFAVGLLDDVGEPAHRTVFVVTATSDTLAFEAARDLYPALFDGCALQALDLQIPETELKP